ncbi:Abi family protein [Companilactobacillus nantensis]|nr:Abi family protein [Companilactobacillus nantensis]GEO64076.1 hypothetical protein LNA01_12590 [Companilactobacillus nantensis]
MYNRKEFKMIEDQIKILESRGMIIPDHAKCGQYLLTNNYYNIINGYSTYFQMDNSTNEDEYIEGTYFDEVCHLYAFDNEVKQTMFKAILNVEHHLKSIFAYRFAEANPDKRYSYLDINCYSDSETLNVGYIISRLSRIINQQKKYSDSSINHYVRHYNDVPIWVIIDYLDFGELSTMIKCVPESLQNKIAKDLVSFIKDNLPEFNDSFTASIMISFINNIRETRNICAHNNRLLDFKCRADSMYFPSLHEKYGISSDSFRKRTFSTFISMQCFLSHTEFAVLNNTLRKRFKHLSNQLNSIEINDVSCLLGFPDNWQKQVTIPQP